MFSSLHLPFTLDDTHTSQTISSSLWLSHRICRSNRYNTWLRRDRNCWSTAVCVQVIVSWLDFWKAEVNHLELRDVSCYILPISVGCDHSAFLYNLKGSNRVENLICFCSQTRTVSNFEIWVFSASSLVFSFIFILSLSSTCWYELGTTIFGSLVCTSLFCSWGISGGCVRCCSVVSKN